MTNTQDDSVHPVIPERSRRLLDPVERVSEILFGLIMALTFTLTISLVEAETKEVRDMLLAAISCNIAWGIVDGVMYTLTSLAARGHDRLILDFIQKTRDADEAREFISEAMPPVVANTLSAENFETIRKKLSAMPEPVKRV